MNNENYKDRFLDEYTQLEYRICKLDEMLRKYREGTLEFETPTPYEVYNEQLVHMQHYLNVLKQRAKLENINLVNF